jgi:hypothetical protein
VRRSNIIAVNEPLAARPHEWMQLLDDRGFPVHILPPLGLPMAKSQPVAPAPPVMVMVQAPAPPALPALEVIADLSPAAEADTTAMREIQIKMAFESLPEDGLKNDGTPNVNTMRALTGFHDLTAVEVLPLWEAFKNPTANDEE